MRDQVRTAPQHVLLAVVRSLLSEIGGAGSSANNFMILAILVVLGNPAATFISIFGAYALLSAMGFISSMVLLLAACLYSRWSAVCCATLSRNAIILRSSSCILETAYYGA